MKKIFIPSIKELHQMEQIKVDTYSYLLIKVIEHLVIDGKNYYAKGILNEKNTYKYILRDPSIVIPICKLYPELIYKFDFAKQDSKLCLDILNKNTNNEIYKLDNLQYFDNNLLTSNIRILETSIEILARNLKNRPEYRFEYAENQLLDEIFSTNIYKNQFIQLLINNKYDTINELAIIEPYYAYLFGDKELLRNSINKYKERYGIQEDNTNKKIDMNDIKVKRLIKTINMK